VNKRDKIRRAIAFYISVLLFCILLPVMLSYALGYKIDLKKFKIYKTGIIYLKSNPVGASIYINGTKHADITPARIENMKPDTYKVEVRREGFYPWEKDLVVRPNMVTKVEQIVLFPITQEPKRIARYPVADFVISEKGAVYHMTDHGVFISDADGSSLKKISSYSNWPEKINGKKFSPSGDKILYFSRNDIFVIYLNLDKAVTKDVWDVKVEEILITEYPIVDVYWYSDSGYIVVVTEKGISVVELRGEGVRNIVLLYKFNSTPRDIYYDKAGDSLYFTDDKREEGLKEGRYLYRLDLRKNFFGQFMRLLLRKEEALIQ
jgi:hypothetical protein